MQENNLSAPKLLLSDLQRSRLALVCNAFAAITELGAEAVPNHDTYFENTGKLALGYEVHESIYHQMIELLLRAANKNLLLQLFSNQPDALFAFTDAISFVWLKLAAKGDTHLIAAFAYAYKLLERKEFFKQPHVTPLHLCVRDGSPLQVDIMLRLELSATVVDHEHKNIIDYGMVQNNEPVLRYLHYRGILQTLRPSVRHGLPLLDAIMAPVVRPSIRVILDIDNTLGHFTVRNRPWTKKFYKNKVCINCKDGFYVLLPGAIELIRFLASLPDVQILFFSAGQTLRNEEFVSQLLQLALGPISGTRLFAATRIYSKIHCTPQLPFPQLQESRLALRTTTFTKNLHCILPDLRWTVLVDDIQENAFVGQAGNLLYLPQTEDIGIEDALISEHRRFRNNDPQYEDSDLTFSTLNQCFYIAGILQRAIQKADREQICLAEALFQIQYVALQGSFRYRAELARDKEIYVEGLQAVRKTSPKACFLTGDSWYLTFFKRSRQLIKMVAKEQADPTSFPAAARPS